MKRQVHEIKSRRLNRASARAAKQVSQILGPIRKPVCDNRRRVWKRSGGGLNRITGRRQEAAYGTVKGYMVCGGGEDIRIIT